MTNEEVSETGYLLQKNFRHLGFNMEFFESYRVDYDEIVRGSVRCPCGGLEYFSFVTESLYPPFSLKPDLIAKRIVGCVASESHLKEDVESGLLPAFDYQKHVFKELVT